MTRDRKPESPADRSAAGGYEAVVSSLRHASREMGVKRGLETLGRVNQTNGFDCPGCAWPDPASRSHVEFCENGAKAVAHEATRRRITRKFLAKWSRRELLARSDQWLEAQGRLCEPMWRPAGEEHFRPMTWEEAFARVAEGLRALDTPDQALFYTSGRTSNEAAFLYQLLARRFGTNNLPDCSNMCHESSGVGLQQSIGVGKGTVSLEDFAQADAIFVIGQNPGTNHPRMLSALQAAKRGGCRIVSINPLRERGLVAFAHPQEPLGLLGVGTALSDLYLQVRVGGDVALLQGLSKCVLEREAKSPGVLDRSFLDAHTEGFAAFEEAIAARSWADLERQSGIARAEMEAAAEVYVAAERVIACWAMGITQHKHGVANVQEIMNLLLLRGNVGVSGAGPCPVRGHSNVQGDRTVGITERPAQAFLDRLEACFGFAAPREEGLDTVGSIRALEAGEARVFIAMGGNFAVASPDTDRTRSALERCELGVHIATKLNRTHLVGGRETLVLPCLGRTERDEQEGGRQFVSVENSMSVVHRSEGRLAPASDALRSEPAIVAGIGEALFGPEDAIEWSDLVTDYDAIRDRIEDVVPGFEDYNARVRESGGFVLPSGARTRAFETESGRAHFVVHPLPPMAPAEGRFLLTTIRSHDQFNTTVYGLDDRYRGVQGDRRVIFLAPEDLAALGLREGDRVDVTSHFRGETRQLRDFGARSYGLPRGCAAAYFPEANPLVPIDSMADGSRTPTYKSLEVSIARSGA